MATFRIDHWAAPFPDEVQWQIYYKIKAMRWTDAADWLQKEYDLERKPGRTSIYDFKTQMRKDEFAHRMAQIAQARAEAAAIARGAHITDDETVTAYKQLAVELAVTTGNAKDAATLVNMATAITDRQLHAQELELRKQAQATKDSALALAREKFEAAERRLEAAKSTLGDTKLTDEAKLAKMKEIFG